MKPEIFSTKGAWMLQDPSLFYFSSPDEDGDVEQDLINFLSKKYRCFKNDHELHQRLREEILFTLNWLIQADLIHYEDYKVYVAQNQQDASGILINIIP